MDHHNSCEEISAAMSASNSVDDDTHKLKKKSVIAAAAKAHAKAEAALTRAAYAKRQIDMEVEKARIEATLNVPK